jgi:glycosyltransferase involved in cell wall biosynthesis
MHILLIHQAFAALDEPGGTRHHEFARYLASQDHKVTIIASPVSYLTGKSRQEHIPWIEKLEDGAGVTVLRAYTYPVLHRSFILRIFSFLSFMFSSFFVGLQVKDIDLVWGTSPPIFQSVTAWALARLKRVPFLLEIRDLWPAFAIAVGVLKQPILVRASEWLERFLYRHADLVIVNSPGFTDHVLARGVKQVELVPNGADVAMFDPQSNGDEFRQKHGLEGKFVALYAGAHGMSNDLEVVLEAAELLGEQKDLIIVLVGDGKDKPVLEARAKEMGLSNLKFIPPVPKNDMPETLAAADACIAILKPIPLYGTVYPNKVFDYMAAGRPVVLAIDGVIKDLVETAEAGIPVPPGDPKALADALLTLVEDPQQGIAMGNRGHEYVKNHFDRSAQAQYLTRIIETMVRSNKV